MKEMLNKIHSDPVLWLLFTLQGRKEQFHGRSSRKEIFLGCYDVWECEQDRIDALNEPTRRLNEVRDLGLITNESGNKDWKYNENWSLTEAGEKYLYEACPDLLNNNI